MRIITKEVESPIDYNCDTLVIPVLSSGKLSPIANLLDRVMGYPIKSLLKNEDFAGKSGSTLLIPVTNGIKARRVLLWGIGASDKADESGPDRQQLLKASTALANACKRLKGKHLAIISDFKLSRKIPKDWLLQTVATELCRITYQYTETKSSGDTTVELNRLSLLNASLDRKQSASAKTGAAIGEGINLARHLGNLPGNICTPRFLSAEARKLGRKYEKVSTRVLGEKAMRELGMGSLLSVGHGSDEESQLITMEYRGAAKSVKPHVLLGKGITFDTGGISLKPGGKMDEMKFDMCGAASVLGAMRALAEMNLKINVVGVIAAAENMPSGRATKPGDVVTSMSGKTIEILNTDAEGRLVLCDALTYIERYKPQSVVDMATLTGACIVALGHHASGLMSNNDELADRLLSAGESSGDRAWRLPLWSDYQKQLKSPFADLANIGGPSAGTITAGCFLANFAGAYPWAHLDIAGTAWNQGGGKGASGRPVALLCQYLKDLAA